MGVGQARAKLLLFGEHAAVYGHPAVGRSLPWTVSVSRAPGQGWALPGLGPHEAAVRRLIDSLAALAHDEDLTPPQPSPLHVVTDIPLASGFGSSGALCAALVNLFWPSLTLEHRERLSWKAEAQFHGTPSGIDTALALREGWFRLDASVRPASARPLPDPGLVLVVGALVREADAKASIAALAQRRESDPAVRATIDSLGHTAAEAVAALEARDPGPLVPLVTKARADLAALGLETPSLTTVLDVGLGLSGARAGKLSGAGGGGAFFLVFDTVESADAALPRIEAAVPAPLWTCRPSRL